MGCFFGKVKSKKGKNSEKIKRILVSECPGYANYAGDKFKKIQFDPHYKLDKDEVFYIEYNDNLKSLIKNKEVLDVSDQNTTAYDQIISADWEHLDFIIYSKESSLYFQRISSKKYLITKKFLGMKGDPELREEQEGIEIVEYPDFSYNKNVQKIFFKDFSKLEKILTGIDELYREATDEEIKLFLNSDFIKTENVEIKNISVSKRKKMAQAIDKLAEINVEELKEYGKKYSNDVFIEDKIIINNKNDIDIVLKIIFEKFYTSEVTREKREANSTRILV